MLIPAETDKKIRPVEYYDGRAGYDEHFLNTVIPLPDITPQALAFGNIAAVKNTDDNVLRYTHFSLVFNAGRKLPFFTVVNIDGNLWSNIKRSEDLWYYDPRIDIDIQIGDDFYSNEPAGPDNKGWFDHGHLVRRLDPAWGDQNIALLGNEDTFHFTNCSPQYWGFNQGSELWAGLENYILYNTDDENVKATVFTGPGFQQQDEEHRDVLVPQYFWKVVLVDSADGTLYSSAYTVDQSRWAQNIPFQELPVGQFQHFQVPVADIQTDTGLLFSNDVLNADVLKDKPRKPLRGLADIVHPRR